MPPRAGAGNITQPRSGLAELGTRVARPVACGQARTVGFVGDTQLRDDPRDRGRSSGLDPRPPSRGLAVPVPRAGGAAPADRRVRRRSCAGPTRTASSSTSLRAKNVLVTCSGGAYALHLIDVPFARHLAVAGSSAAPAGCAISRR